MKKIVLILIALCVAVFGRDFESFDEVVEFIKNERQQSVKECMGGNVESCEKASGSSHNYVDAKDRYYYVSKIDSIFSGYTNIGSCDSIYGRCGRDNTINCKDYMKVIKKGCALGSGICCAFLGDEYNSISVYSDGRWQSKYGRNCSLKNQNEAFKYYRKSCELGESYGCESYSEFEMDLAEIQARERDKTQKSDITIRRK